VVSPDAIFVQLLVRHQNIVHKICRAYCPLAEDRRDLFQEIVLQLWRAYPTFRNESKESTWIYRISLNVAITGLRKARGQSVGPLTEVMQQIPNEESDIEEQIGMLYKAMYILSDVEKALVLLYFEEKTNDEIAELTGFTPNHIRVKMHRIREKLRAYFQTIHSK
jgi:RNA polymerase sigma factor (sigma-70 family)